jgi:hypothetical protein
LLIDHGYDEAVPRNPDARVRSLAQAADWIMDASSKERLLG